ncbi:hypothetical protein EES44_30420 [Streptomyces sp. ADI96-15]|nr:hypothetical protein EES44_30420 [Streptomyces sp. ADI96-15]
MAQWVENYSLEAPEGHRWERPAPEDCPRCPCHTARVCRVEPGHPAETADGAPYAAPCPCEGLAGRCAGSPHLPGRTAVRVRAAAMLADSPPMCM